MFVCLFVVNAQTMERIDAKCSGITKTDPECPSGVEIAILVLLERYHGNSSFFFVCINWEGTRFLEEMNNGSNPEPY